MIVASEENKFVKLSQLQGLLLDNIDSSNITIFVTK